ncbi:hypothetical protein IJ182_05515 [bacterium]|nr:hypothetical protein [bacterium]
MIKKIISTSLLSLFVFFAIGVDTAALAVQIPSNTPVVVQLDRTITQETAIIGDIVTFHVVNTVTDMNDNALIKKGTPVYGKVIDAHKQGRIGISGKIVISDFYTNAVDGTPINLNGVVKSAPKNKMKSTIAWSVILCGLFMLRKGDKAFLQEGYQATVFTK